MALPQVLQEGRDGARQVARAARAARGPGHEAGALTETHKHNPPIYVYRVYGRAREGWGGLGRLQGAVLMFGYGFTDLRI